MSPRVLDWPSGHEIFRLNAEGMRKPRIVVEQRYHLRRVVNFFVGQARAPERDDAGFGCGRGVARQPDRVVTYCPCFLVELRLAVIPFDPRSQLRIIRYRTEILPVSLESIKAAVGPGSDRRKRFALHSRKR